VLDKRTSDWHKALMASDDDNWPDYDTEAELGRQHVADIAVPAWPHVAVELWRECCICFENAKRVLSCSEDHHLCLTCSEGYIKAETEGSRQRIMAAGGKLRCPSDSCTAVFKHYDLAKFVPRATYDKLLAAWHDCIEQTAFQAAAETTRKVAALRSAQSEVDRARADIIDTILTLQCPRCSKAFDSFEGCFALHCRDTAGHGCGVAFCGYCLSECGEDAHAHVGQCTHNTAANKELFGTIEMFVKAQQLRRKKLVEEYLSKLPAELRARVKCAIAPDLYDLGIVLRINGQAVEVLKALCEQAEEEVSADLLYLSIRLMYACSDALDSRYFGVFFGLAYL